MTIHVNEPVPEPGPPRVDPDHAPRNHQELTSGVLRVAQPRSTT